MGSSMSNSPWLEEWRRPKSRGGDGARHPLVLALDPWFRRVARASRLGSHAAGSRAVTTAYGTSHQAGVHPGGDGQEAVIAADRANHLDADGQAVGTREAGQVDCRRVQERPHAIEDRIAGSL